MSEKNVERVLNRKIKGLFINNELIFALLRF